MDSFDVRAVEIFRAVAEAGSATEAAHNLKITQPAVTRAIAEFERKCGLMLFRRGRHGMSLTDDGRMLYEEVQRSYVGMERIAAAVRSIQNGRRGDLRIIAIPALVEGSIGRLLGDFSRDHPEIRLQVGIETQEGVLRSIGLELADLGFLFGPLSSQPHLDATPIGTRRMLVALPAGHPLAIRRSLRVEDLADERIVLISPPHTIRSIVELRFFEAARQPQVSCEAATQKAVAAIVATGAGVGFIDSEVASQIDARRVATVPFEPPVTWTIQTVRNKNRHISGPLRSLLRRIRDGASTEIDTLAGDSLPARNVRRLRPRML